MISLMVAYISVFNDDGLDNALDDIKDLSRTIRLELFNICNEILTDSLKYELVVDEQYIGTYDESLYMMKRALRNEDRNRIAAMEDGDPDSPLTLDFWIVYRKLTQDEVDYYGGPGFWVHRILHRDNLAWGVQKLVASH